MVGEEKVIARSMTAGPRADRDDICASEANGRSIRDRAAPKEISNANGSNRRPVPRAVHGFTKCMNKEVLRLTPSTDNDLITPETRPSVYSSARRRCAVPWRRACHAFVSGSFVCGANLADLLGGKARTDKDVSRRPKPIRWISPTAHFGRIAVRGSRSGASS